MDDFTMRLIENAPVIAVLVYLVQRLEARLGECVNAILAEVKDRQEDRES